MKETIDRNYLEIKSINALIESMPPELEDSINLVKTEDFQVNRFFYKNVGKKHGWVDRLAWTDNQWKNYVFSSTVETFVLKNKKNMAGYFELIHHKERNEIEIAYLGLLEEYINKKLGSILLSSAIKKAFLKSPKRVWVHTCSLDHKNALNNYLSRGMKIFKEEVVSI